MKHLLRNIKYNRLLILYNELFFNNINVHVMKSGSIIYSTDFNTLWLVDVIGNSTADIYKNKLKVGELSKLPTDFIMEQLVKRYDKYIITICD